MIFSRLKWYGLAGLLILLTVSILLVLSPKHEEETRPLRSTVEVRTILPTPVDLPILREVPGVVVSVSQGTLASKVTGLVEEVRVREGDPVKVGQVLILLDNRDLQAQLERAQAEVDTAKAHYERIQRLYDEESVSQQELDNAQRAYKVAEAARKAIEANLAYTLIKAPFDGVITDKMIEEGELATPGRPLLRLEDNTSALRPPCPQRISALFGLAIRSRSGWMHLQTRCCRAVSPRSCRTPIPPLNQLRSRSTFHFVRGFRADFLGRCPFRSGPERP